MYRRIALILLFLVLPGLLQAAGERRLRKLPPQVTLSGLEDLPANLPIAYPPYPPLPPGTDEIIGDTTTVGTTWYDIQHNSQMGRMIVKDEYGYIHMAFTSGIDEGSVSRHVFYNFIDPQGNQGFPGTGTQIDASTRAGFITLCVGWEGRAFPAFHQIQGVTVNPHSAVAVDFLPHLGGFTVFELPWYNGEDRPFIWPHIAMKQDQQMLIISRDFDSALQTWSFGTVDSAGSIYTISFTPQELTEDAAAISNDVGASPVSNRAGIAYPATAFPQLGYPEPGLDIHALVDDDGVNLDFMNWWNVTNFFPPDLSWLPGDTLMANADTLRAWADASIFFDMDDVCHISFTTIAWFTLEGGFSYWNASCIWHWSEQWPNEYHLVAKNWDPNSQVSCGNWSFSTQRPSMGQDPTTGHLYLTYQQYDVDPAHLAANGYPSSDIYISVSTDGGQRWAVGTNVTNTPTEQGALPGQCLSESFATMAELVDDYCHLFYQLDLDAGQAVASEGMVTFNSLKYHRVPVEGIATAPLMPNDPFHVQHIEDTTRTTVTPSALPHQFALEQNVPNPFNPTTMIRFSLEALSDVELAVYDLRGELVAVLAKGVYQAGTHTIGFDGGDLPSGLYLYRLQAGEQSLARKMVLVK